MHLGILASAFIHTRSSLLGRAGVGVVATKYPLSVSPKEAIDYFG